MKEFIGFCSECGKQIFCLDGFLNGVVSDDKKRLYCFQCSEKKKEN
ncbi:hypothetical protein MGA3_00870 [Bacillus methanolicus MGA3]|nr:hypothetical protein MGA3_00870 [Bacillus methanolicus MGA3]